jgi:ABC-type transporter Mla subunit MlaD
LQRKHRNETLIGAFMALGLLLFVLLLFLMGSLDPLLGHTTIVEANFPDVQTLEPGDPVYLFGMRVGKVISVNLLDPVAGEPASIRVGLRIPMHCRKYLREDSRVRIDKTLTGNISVLIQEGSGKPLAEGARLAGSPTADFGVVTEKVNAVLQEADKLVGTISSMVKEIEARGDLTGAVSDIAALVKEVRGAVIPLADQLRQALDQVDQMLTENRLDVRHTVANLKETTALAKNFTERMGTTPELVQQSISELEKAAAATSDLIAGNRSHVDTILEDLRAVSTNAATLTAEIKRRPWRLLYRPSEEEESEMDLYDAAWAYNLGATELNRSVRDLVSYLKQDRQGVPEEKLKEAEERVHQSLLRQREFEDAFWQRLQASR